MAEKEDEECRKRRNRWHGAEGRHRKSKETLEECVELVLPALESSSSMPRVSQIIRTFTFLKIRHLAPAISGRGGCRNGPCRRGMTWNAKVQGYRARGGDISVQKRVARDNQRNVESSVEWRVTFRYIAVYWGCTVASAVIRSISVYRDDN